MLLLILALITDTTGIPSTRDAKQGTARLLQKTKSNQILLQGFELNNRGLLCGHWKEQFLSGWNQINPVTQYGDWYFSPPNQNPI